MKLISTQPQFLTWVRTEHKRLINREQRAAETITEERYKTADDYLRESYYWLIHSATLAQPMSMFVVGSLLYDHSIPHYLYKELLKDIDNNLYSKETQEISLYQDLQPEDELECRREGYKWTWRAALGDVNYKEDPPTVPDGSIWMKKRKNEQSGLAWYDLAAIHCQGDEELQIKPSDSLSEEMFKIAADTFDIAAAHYCVALMEWKHWEKIPKEERLQHPAMIRMHKGLCSSSTF